MTQLDILNDICQTVLKGVFPCEHVFTYKTEDTEIQLIGKSTDIEQKKLLKYMRNALRSISENVYIHNADNHSYFNKEKSLFSQKTAMFILPLSDSQGKPIGAIQMVNPSNSAQS